MIKGLLPELFLESEYRPRTKSLASKRRLWLSNGNFRVVVRNLLKSLFHAVTGSPGVSDPLA